MAVVMHFSRVPKNSIMGFEFLLIIPTASAKSMEKFMVPRIFVPSWYLCDITQSLRGADEFSGGSNTVRYWEMLAFTMFGGYIFLKDKGIQVIQ